MRLNKLAAALGRTSLLNLYLTKLNCPADPLPLGCSLHRTCAEMANVNKASNTTMVASMRGTFKTAFRRGHRHLHAAPTLGITKKLGRRRDQRERRRAGFRKRDRSTRQTFERAAGTEFRQDHLVGGWRTYEGEWEAAAHHPSGHRAICQWSLHRRGAYARVVPQCQTTTAKALWQSPGGYEYPAPRLGGPASSRAWAKITYPTGALYDWLKSFVMATARHAARLTMPDGT